VVRSKVGDDMAPEGAAHDDAMEQNHDRAVAARVLILDGPGAEFQVRHLGSPEMAWRATNWEINAAHSSGLSSQGSCPPGTSWKMDLGSHAARFLASAID
jgi:hypothetical protein